MGVEGLFGEFYGGFFVFLGFIGGLWVLSISFRE